MALKKNHFGFPVAALLLLLLVWEAPLLSAEEAKTLLGKYYAEICTGDKNEIDTIEFLPDGKCLISFCDHPAELSGSYQGISDGKLTIKYGDPTTSRIYKADLVKRALKLTDETDATACFALRPEAPYPKAEELLGVYSYEYDDGHYIHMCIYRRTADHMAETLVRMLSKSEHTYNDFRTISKWIYADGITTYELEKTDMPFQWDFSRDFIAKHDEKGIWSLDTNLGDYVCETPVKAFELPPPPAGFHKSR